MKDEIEKHNVNEAQLKTYIRELNGGNIPNMGTNPTRSEIIQQLLDIAATSMSYYGEHYWLVAKNVLKRKTDKLTMHVDIMTLKQVRAAIQSCFLTATNVPDDLSLEDKLSIVVCPEPYVDVGPSISRSLAAVDPTVKEWISIGKWMGY